MQVQTSSCPKCGAPIYAESLWWSILPPPPIYTCGCTAASRRTYVTSNTCDIRTDFLDCKEGEKP